MLKKDAVAFFNGVVAMANDLEMTHPAISQWPEVLTTGQADRVRGAAVRLRRRLPPHLREASGKRWRGAKSSKQKAPKT